MARRRSPRGIGVYLALAGALALTSPSFALAQGSPAADAQTAPAVPAPGTTGPAVPEVAAPEAPAAGPPQPPPFTPPPPPNPSQSNIPYTGGFDFPFVNVAALEFHPSLAVSEQYTDNFFLTLDDRRENFRTAVTPGFLLLINTPKSRGSVSTSFGFTFDTLGDRKKFNLYPNISASIRHFTTPTLTLTLTESMRSGDDIGDSDPFAVRGTERRSYLSNSLSFSAEWLVDIFRTQFFYRNSLFLASSTVGGSDFDDRTLSNIVGSNVSFPFFVHNEMRFGYEISHSDASDRDSSDRDQSDEDSISRGGSFGHLIYASISRQFTSFLNGGISTSYSIRSRESVRTWNISGFGVYAIPNGLMVSGSLGYSLLSSDENPDRSIITTSTTISYPFGRVVARVGVSQDFRQSYVLGEDVGIVMTRSVNAGVSFPITEVTSGNVNVFFNENDPTGVGNDRQAPSSRSLSGTAAVSSRFFTAGIRGSFGENQVIGRINDRAERAGDTLILGIFATHQIFTWLSLNADYSHLLRDGGQATSEKIRENRATVTLRASF